MQDEFIEYCQLFTKRRLVRNFLFLKKWKVYYTALGIGKNGEFTAGESKPVAVWADDDYDPSLTEEQSKAIRNPLIQELLSKGWEPLPELYRFRRKVSL